MPIKYFADSILIKCLMSQPLDVISQAAIASKSSLKKALSKLPEEKLNRIKDLCREILVDELRSSDASRKVRTDQETSTTYEDSPELEKRIYNDKDQERVTIKENYSQKLFDNLPMQFQAMAKVMVDSLGKDTADKTISGMNIIFEGLSRLGINVFDGFLIAAPRVQVEDEEPSEEINRKTSKPVNINNSNNGPIKESNAHRIEIMEDEKPKNKMDEID
jgi:hypothetical protein